MLDSASFNDSDKTIMYRGICVDKKICGCAIYVHLQLDLLKFYLAILKCHPGVSVIHSLARLVLRSALLS